MPELQTVEIKRLWQGISTQNVVNRFEGQVTDLLNVRPDLDRGAVKRAGHRFIRNMPGFIPDEPYRYATHETETRTNIIVFGRFDDGSATAAGQIQIRAFDALDGSDVPVYGNVSFAYLGSDLEAIHFTSNFGTVMVGNRNFPLALEAAPNQTVVNNPLTGKPSVSDYFKLIEDGAIAGLFVPGDTIYAKNDYTSSFPSGWYRLIEQPTPSTHHWQRRWERVAEPNQPDARWDPTTAPHRLRYDESGFYAWDTAPYEYRLSGNKDSNPIPAIAFVRAMAFHLGGLFMADDFILANPNRKGFLHYFINNINNQTDSDPIVRDITETNTGRLLEMTGVGGSLFMSFKQAQVEFSSFTQDLTPITGQFRTISDFTVQDEIRITTNGDVIHLVDDANNVQRFIASTSPRSRVDYVGDVTRHVSRMSHSMKYDQLFHFDDTLFALASRAIPSIGVYYSNEGRAIDALVWKVGNILYLRVVGPAGPDDIQDWQIDLSDSATQTTAQVVAAIIALDPLWQAWTVSHADGFMVEAGDFTEVGCIGTIANSFQIHRVERLILSHTLQAGADGQVVQSAWSRLDFGAAARHLVKMSAHLAAWLDYTPRMPSGTLEAAEGADVRNTLVSYPMREKPPTSGYDVHLDRRQIVPGNYEPSVNETWFETKSIPRLADSLIVLRSGTPGRILIPTRVEGNIIVIDGRWDQVEAFYGELYTAMLELPRIFWKTELGGAVARRISVDRLTSFHTQTAAYEIVSRAPGRAEGVKQITAKRADVSLLDIPAIEDGYGEKTRCGNGQTSRITLRSRNAAPCTWASVTMRVDVGDVAASSGATDSEIYLGIPGD